MAHGESSMKKTNEHALAYQKAGGKTKVNAFKRKILDVCKKHGYSIAHEDRCGAFEIVPFEDELANWFDEAIIKLRNWQ
jgi:hypothetical protein